MDGNGDAEEARLAYLFENLGPERFQEFCQALLVKDYPDLQCFPVAQPDGGRDALSRFGDDGVETVGQIKFKRTEEPESAEWMIRALEMELPKILELVSRGAKRYIMVTNAASSAHLDVGRIDRVQEWFSENVPIQAFCLWRADITARLDGASTNLKLAYPELLTGQDALVLVVEAQMGPERERISRAFRAFAAKQFRLDQDVKFKQVDLSNSLLGLFVDVPVELNSILSVNDRPTPLPRSVVMAVRDFAENNGTFVRAGGHRVWLSGGYSHRRTAITADAAEFLLAPGIQDNLPWIVLQGAPGQGKSTLAQYVCQVHRALFLDKVDFLEKVDAAHLHTGFRLPFKVDLRDLADYLDGRTFLGLNEAVNPGPRSFEGFLAELVHIESGGLAFSVDDLASTLTASPALFFLDGLDEVAEPKLRRKLVEEVLDGLQRLKDNSANVQVVVTSRPSLFGTNPLFANSQFIRLDLAPIGPTTINAYAEKWLIARKIEDAEGVEIKLILDEKLRLSHIRELTRNPMQLTILLSLIHQYGVSLPDVRTDLYRQYVDLFLLREAEKSPMVRGHRQLLLEIVQYLAWKLQSRAESESSSGSISRDDLRAVVEGYLVDARQPTAILNDLFTGGLERIYVLVQRVDGFYEFEVQPLREYFASRYLYTTAPMGTFRNVAPRGDRAQRFEALTANPYWANVTRFYGGSYESGELGALVTSLKVMIETTDLAASIHARSIGAALLTDWVFRAKKPIQAQVIDLVFDQLGVRLAASNLLAGFEDSSLDVECGRDDVARLIFERDVAEAPNVSIGICKLLRRNGGPQLKGRFAQWIDEAAGSSRTRRIRVAFASGMCEEMSAEEATSLLFADSPNSKDKHQRLIALLTEGPRVIESSDALSEAALESILDWGGRPRAVPTTQLGWLAALAGGDQFHLMDSDLVKADERLGLVVSKLRSIDPGIGRNDDPWASPERWSAVVEAVREGYGERWLPRSVAVESSGLVPLVPTVATSLFDEAIPLFDRAMGARSWRGRTSWWSDQLGKARTDEDRLFWACMLLGWAPTKYISANLEVLNEVLGGMPEGDFMRLIHALEQAASNRNYRGGRLRKGVSGVRHTDRRLTTALVAALEEPQLDVLPKEADEIPEVRDAIARRDALRRLHKFPGWEVLSASEIAEWIDIVGTVYGTAGELPPYAFDSIREAPDMGADVAAQILKTPSMSSHVLVELSTVSILAGYVAPSLTAVADAEDWEFA